jgi:archaellum component FlaC
MSNILDDIPPEFICPITHLLMEYPFITGAGNSYEYSALVHWLQKKNSDPVTGGVLADKTIVPNNSLRSSIQSWLAFNPNGGSDMRNAHAQKPPQEAYIPAGDKKTAKETPLHRVLRVGKCFELDKSEKKNQRLLQEQRLRTITSYGHTYTWDSEGKHVRCDNQPTWVKAPSPDMFVTPLGIVFFNCGVLRDARVLPGTDLVDACEYRANCTKNCGFAHPFVCRLGVSCRNQENGRCKFFHPSVDSVIPLGTSYPLNQECKYRVNCSNLTCMFAHPLGRMTVQRQASRMFVTHTLDLQELVTPIDLQIEWPASCTLIQFQGEFVFAFEPYPGTWAKKHFRSVTVLRFDAGACRYRKIANYALEGHYCNCAVAAGRYMVLSFWPYEEEAMRTVWECLHLDYSTGKTLKKTAAEITSLHTQLQEKEAELSTMKSEMSFLHKQLQEKEAELSTMKSEMSFLHKQLQEKDTELIAVKSELLSTKEEVEKLRLEVRDLQDSLSRAQETVKNKEQQISRMAAEYARKDRVHAQQMQILGDFSTFISLLVACVTKIIRFLFSGFMVITDVIWRVVIFMYAMTQWKRNDEQKSFNALTSEPILHSRQHYNYDTLRNSSNLYIPEWRKPVSIIKSSVLSGTRTERERDQYRNQQIRFEKGRSERLRLRDPIHVYALSEGRTGFESEDWTMVLDYHKGAHDLSISAPRSDGSQVLEVVEHSKVIQFELCVPRNVADIGAALPLQPGRLCEEF